MKDNNQNAQKLLLKAYKNPDFKGKEVVIVGSELHILSIKNMKARIKLLTSLTKKYPHYIPVITLIPKENTLILFL